MPLTPTFDISYPCEADQIDCTVFSTFTEGIQAALVDVDALEPFVLHRPAAYVQVQSGAQTFPINVNTNIMFDTELFDNDTMVDLAVQNTRITIMTAGIYMVTGWIQADTGWTNLTSESANILQNGVLMYRRKTNSDTNQAMAPQTIGILQCQVGDFLQLGYLWNGTGGPVSLTQATFSANYMASL